MKKSMPRYHRYISIIGLGGVEVKGRLRLWSVVTHLVRENPPFSHREGER